VQFGGAGANDCAVLSGQLGRYLSLEVWPARQARNAASACSRSSALLILRRGCFGDWLATSGLSLRSSTPCRRMRLRLAIRDQFARTINPPPTCSAFTGQPPVKHEKPGGLAVTPQTSTCGDAVGAVEPGNTCREARSDAAIIHPRFAAWHQATRHALRMSALCR
jgi:hypothetical protein